MKITKENINDKWPEIEKYISENNKKEAKASYLEMARDWDSLSQEFTDEEKDETLEMMDEFISKINAQVETGMKKEASAQKKSRDNRKKVAAKGREHFATVRKNKKEAKKQKKDEAKVIKMNNTNSSKSTKDYTTSRVNYTLTNMYENYVSMSYDEYVADAGKSGYTNDVHVSKEVIFDSMEAFEAMDRDSYETIVTKTDAKNLKHISLSDKMREQLKKQFGKDTKYCFFPFVGITTHAIALYVKSELKAVINCEGHNYGKYLLIPSDKTKKDTSKTYAWWNKNIDKEKIKMINSDCGGKFTPTTTSSRTSNKTKVAEAPNWLKTIRSFVNSCGKEKTVASIRTQLININDRFDAKRNLNTPHIDLIREIQEKLLPYGNKKSVKRVVLPAWESFVAQCKAAINSISVSTKLEKEAIKNGSLAGFVPVWRIDYLSDNKMGFKTLAKAKEYIKSLPLERVKKMTRQHTFIYHDKDGEIDKVCNFNISGGKVVFKPVERY